MYTFESRIRYSETGENGKLGLTGIIDYMQDCTNFHSEDLGVGQEYYLNRKIMWVLSSWQIIVEDYPAFGERITVGTQSYGFEKMFGYRNFLITKEDGSRVAIANSIWVLMDLEKGRPMLVTPEIGEIYGSAKPLEMEYAPRKIKLPQEGEVGEKIIVKEEHLDTNHHVNNGQYVRMAMNAANLKENVKELRAEYKKQAVLGDEICPVIYREENQVFVSLNDVDGKVYAIIQLICEK